jgi:hypothetical protein
MTNFAGYTTVQGEEITFYTVGDTITLNDATVVAPDILAFNGITHGIDTVLTIPATIDDLDIGTADDDGLCEAFLAVLFGSTNTGCTCDDAEPSDKCLEFLSSCSACDTVQGERTCFTEEVEKSNALSSDDVDAYCYTYESGLFDNTICELYNPADDTCTITIDGTECSSCALVTCDDDDFYDIDCSNVIEGETWNQCTDDIPETSRFLATANNDRYLDFSDCGGSALSFRALSVVSLMVVVTFW